MAYIINKTDGTIVATVADGQIDTLSTDLTLIGKNYSGYGEGFNENFVKLLENFASTSEPPRPIRGQIWFDATELKLKVYSGTTFLPVSSATIANTQPSTLGVGDLWFNDVDKQLYFYDGTSTILLGPSYSESQGLSGLRVGSVLDSLNQTRVITYLYNNGILLGIFSKDAFTPKNVIDGYSGDIGVGFNAGTLANFKFDVTCTNAEQLGGVDAITYVRKDTSNSIDGQVRITTNLGLVIGAAGEANLTVNNGNIFLSNAAGDKNITLNVKKGITQEEAFKITATTRTIEMYKNFSDSEVQLGGSLTVNGNLTVNGDLTTVSTTELVIEDKNIILGSVGDSSSGDDDFIDGGGITLRGSLVDKDFLWLKGTGWYASDSLTLDYAKSFKIINSVGTPVPIMDATSFYGTSIPNVTSFGAQVFVDIGPDGVTTPAAPIASVKMRLTDNKIFTAKDNLDLELEANGTGNIALLGSPKITGLADPTDANDGANKNYVDTYVRSRPLVFSMDLTDGKNSTYIINNVLDNLAPASEYEVGTVARILCTILANSTSSVDLNPNIQAGITLTTVTTPGPGTANVVGALSVAPSTVPAQGISTSRVIKQFSVRPGPVWGYDSGSDIILPP